MAGARAKNIHKELYYILPVVAVKTLPKIDKPAKQNNCKPKLLLHVPGNHSSYRDFTICQQHGERNKKQAQCFV